MNHADHVTLKRYPVLNSLNMGRQNVISMNISQSSVYTMIASRFGKNEKEKGSFNPCLPYYVFGIRSNRTAFAHNMVMFKS